MTPQESDELTPQQRRGVEAYLIRKTGMSAIEAAALDDMQLAEHVMAVNGRAVVSAEIANEIERIKAANWNVPVRQLNAVVYAIYSGAYGEYHRIKEQVTV